MRLVALFGLIFLCPRMEAQAQPHFVLVHGGGPSVLVGLKKMRSNLIALGVSPSKISLPTYFYRDSLDAINRDLKNKLKPILEAHTSSIILTHSLGDFVALRAVLELGMTDKISHFIAFGGVVNGQDEVPSSCERRPCPPYLEQLTPFQGPFTQSIWLTHTLFPKGFKHCAVFSLDDKRVRSPHDSAAFASSTKVVLRDYSHWDLATNPGLLKQALDACSVQVLE